MKTLPSKILLIALVLISVTINAQNPGYWQQHVDYTMEIDMNVENFQYQGTQKLVYTNNSPDVLTRVYYHLYMNAFQPGSNMDMRLQNIADPDGRMVNNIGTKENPIYESRISKLQPSEIGYMKVKSLTQNGKPLEYNLVDTVLEVNLVTPIQPGEKTTFDMVFDAQVPLQIRRNGRNSKEGVALSMAQWYPKIAEYDFQGWHADSYIAREFHGVWGDFDIKITIDKNYTIGGTGYLQNPEEIGHGYGSEGLKEINTTSDKLTWHFKAPMVHDFTWAADPEYIHDSMQVPDGPMIHFLYKNNPETNENWEALQPVTVKLMQYFSENVGKYPYEQYSVIQGGDGGMEYAMCTLITGGRSLNGLIGVTSHEMAHTWFQFLLATNEATNEWMDEGFTSYISALASNEIMDRNNENPHSSSYNSYIKLANSGFEQPLTTHADRYNINSAYGTAAYSKGAVFLAQLGYVIGEDNLKATLKKYFNDFSFKHPTPDDIIRTAEKVSGLELDWYLTDFAQTTNTINYGIKSVEATDKTTNVTLERKGLMPMPIDLTVEYLDGTSEYFYIPLEMMRGEKPTPDSVKVLPDWSWANNTFGFGLNVEKSKIKSITIDPKGKMADIDNTDNIVSFAITKKEAEVDKN
ncbi:MAG: hypothetical protein ACI93P_000044 [bacterium]|jgi:hypothetical protein